MGHHGFNINDLSLSRRDFLRDCGMGMGALTLGTMLAPTASAQSASSQSLPHFPGTAKRVIHIFCNGGPSHVDTFDPKPALAKYEGKMLPVENLKTERKTGAAFPSPFKFKRYGESGIEVSDLFAKTAEHIDDIAVIRSLKAKVPNHEPSLMLMNTGDAVMSRPSMGSWINYGLGTDNQNLPGFVVLCPGGYPVKEGDNWRAGFLPGNFQGTFIDSKHETIDKLIENIRNKSTTKIEQRQQLDLLLAMNEEHASQRANDAHLDAQIKSFELAYRMQMAATDAFDAGKEPEYIRTMYGNGVHARQTLIARRLLERGVRYVQLWHGAGQPWDNHADIGIHAKLARETDQPIAALIADLKQRGMFEDTLIIWGGEFGRTPTVELEASGKVTKGRDHNPYGFSMWMAGGGVKGGITYGATDEFGFKAVDNVMEVHDLHATMLHLLGFDHEKFTYRYAGRDFRLTDVHGRVIHDLIA